MNIYFIYLIIVLTAATRFLPHPENFAPITAIAIFSAVYLPKKQAVAIPLVARFVSDLFIGFYSWPVMVAVYLAHLSGVLFGLWIRRSTSGVIANPNARLHWPSARADGERTAEGQAILNFNHGIATSSRQVGTPRNDTGKRWLKIISSSFAASVVFFLVTNFAFLYSSYPHTWLGIMQSYANALPFFRGTVTGDVTYTVGLFGAYQLAMWAVWKYSFKTEPIVSGRQK